MITEDKRVVVGGVVMATVAVAPTSQAERWEEEEEERPHMNTPSVGTLCRKKGALPCKVLQSDAKKRL